MSSREEQTDCLFEKLNRTEFSNLVALNFADKNLKITYAQLWRDCEVLRAKLVAHGVQAKDSVLVSFQDEYDWIVSLLALMSLGACSVPVSAQCTPYELDLFLKRKTIDFVLADFDFLTTKSSSLSQVLKLRAVFTTQIGWGTLPASLLSIFTDLSEYPIAEKEVKSLSTLKAPKLDESVTCHFTYKGQGYPLGVTHYYADFVAAVKSCQNIFQFTPGRKLLILLPAYPVFGLVTNILFPLTHGCELVIETRKISSICDSLVNNRIDHLNLIPALAEKMLLEAKKNRKSYDFSKLCFVTGGSHMDLDLLERFESTFQSLPVQGYGLTETLPVLTNTPNHNVKGTLGRLMRKNMALKICDSNGNEVPVGKVGEICLKGEGVANSYIASDGHQENLFRDGWLRTGDLGASDSAGNITFKGRRLAFTKILGQMVDLRECEDLVKTIKGIKNAKAYILKDRGRSRLSLAIFVSSDFKMSKEQLMSFLKDHLSLYKIPAQVKIYKASYVVHEI